MDLARALEAMLDGSYFGTMMVQLGVVDGMVSGAAHTTAHTIRPALEFVKTRDGVKIVSSVFLMLMPDRVLVYGDCAVNPDPNAEQLADIALASAETAAQFGVEPRVAMLSYSTGGSGTGEAVDKVRQATELVKARRPDLAVEGPIQYDAAVDAAIAKSKMPGSSVAGQATVFIFPDLNTGNNTYKAVQQSSGAVAVGPVLQGLRKPVNDLSRGCTVEDIVNTVAITADPGAVRGACRRAGRVRLPMLSQPFSGQLFSGQLFSGSAGLSGSSCSAGSSARPAGVRSRSSRFSGGLGCPPALVLSGWGVSSVMEIPS